MVTVPQISISYLTVAFAIVASMRASAAPQSLVKPVLIMKHPYVYHVAFSPDSKLLASGGSKEYIGLGEVRLWNTRTGKLQRLSKYPNEPVNSVAFSPDGRTLAVVANGLIELRDTRTGKLKRKLKNSRDFHLTGDVAFSPDGKLIAGGGDMAEEGSSDNAYLWQARTGRFIRTLQNSNGPAQVVFLPGGNILAGAISSGYYNDASGVVKLWNVKTGRLRSTQRHPWVNCIAVSPDGQTLATGSAIAVSPDVHTLVTGSGQDVNNKRAVGEIRLWNARTGKLKRILQHDSGITAIAYTPDSKIRASGDQAGMIRLADAATGQIKRTIKAHLRTVNEIAFSPDGRLLASVGDGTVKLWQVKQLTINRKMVNSIRAR